MRKYLLPILFIVHWSCEESEDSNQQNDVIIGSWNFVSENGFSDYECTEPNDDDDGLNLPGASINGTCNISENEISQSITYEVTKEWMCAMMGGRKKTRTLKKRKGRKTKNKSKRKSAINKRKSKKKRRKNID